jgi:hypothetical protein
LWLIGCFDGKYIAVVAIYAPTDLYPLEEKVRFYDCVYVSIPKKYKKKAILGDFNARIGEYIEGAWDSRARGRFVGGESNENGNLLLEFCVTSELFVSSTDFEKKNYGTWTCASDKVEYPIDFCLIPLECKYMLVDPGAKRLAECWIDPILVIMDMEYSTEVVKKVFRQKSKKLDYAALRMLPQLRIAVGQRVDEGIRQIQSTGAIVMYQECTDILLAVCKELIPCVSNNKRRNESWYNPHDVVINAFIAQSAARLPIDRYRYPYTVFEGYRPDRPFSQFIEDPMIIDSR